MLTAYSLLPTPYSLLNTYYTSAEKRERFWTPQICHSLSRIESLASKHQILRFAQNDKLLALTLVRVWVISAEVYYGMEMGTLFNSRSLA